MAVGKRVLAGSDETESRSGKESTEGQESQHSDPAHDHPRRAEMREEPLEDEHTSPETPESFEAESLESESLEAESLEAEPREAEPREAEPVEVETPEAKPAEALEPTGDRPTTSDGVPKAVKLAASWSWRVLLIAAVLVVLGFLFQYLSEVTIPIAIAALLAALLSPVSSRLKKWRVPRGLAAAISVVGGLAVVVGVLTFIIQQIVSQSGELATSAIQAYQQLLGWIAGPPLNIDSGQLSGYGDQVLAWISGLDLASILPGYAATVGSSVGHFLAGFAICLFALFYFLYDGRGIFTALLRLMPRAARPKADAAARNGWNSLVSYVRATVVVAFVDAIGVLIIALILRIPLAIPLAALVFLGAFIPLVGAFVSGFVAVAVALVAVGPIQALIMLAGIILVMQVESHVLQPFLLGRAVALHPLAVLLAIAIGVVLGGIVGAVLAVPMLAFANSYISSLAEAQVTERDAVQLR